MILKCLQYKISKQEPLNFLKSNSKSGLSSKLLFQYEVECNIISGVRVSGRVLENGDYEEGRVDKDNQSNVSEVILSNNFLHFLLTFSEVIFF